MEKNVIICDKCIKMLAYTKCICCGVDVCSSCSTRMSFSDGGIHSHFSSGAKPNEEIIFFCNDCKSWLHHIKINDKEFTISIINLIKKYQIIEKL